MRDVAVVESELATTTGLADGASEIRVAEPARRDFASFPETELRQLLGEAIWDRLPWSELPAGKLDRATLVQAYNGSLERLDTFKQDVTTLLTSACRANLEFRQGQGQGQTHEAARDRALDAELQTMLSRAKWKEHPSMSVVNADVASQPTLLLRRRLNAAIGKAIDDFVAEFHKLLDRLVNAKLIGRIDWKPNHCCGYDFFKHVVVQENKGARRSTTRVRNEGANRQIARPIVAHEVTTDVRGEGQHLHQHEEHEHVVINAVRTSIGDSQVIMPPAVVELTKRVPEWLDAFVQVVDGDLCTESIDTRTRKAEGWQDATVKRRPIYGWEPAVTIGPYVLTGWGPREVAAELARRDAVAAQQHAESMRSWLPSCGATVLAMTSLWLLWRALNGAGGTFFAVLSLAAALTLVWQAVSDRENSRRNPRAATKAGWWTCAVGCGLVAVGLLLVMCFHSLPPVLPLGLLLGALGSVWMADPESFRRNLQAWISRGGARA